MILFIERLSYVVLVFLEKLVFVKIYSFFLMILSFFIFLFFLFQFVVAVVVFYLFLFFLILYQLLAVQQDHKWSPNITYQVQTIQKACLATLDFLQQQNKIKIVLFFFVIWSVFILDLRLKLIGLFWFAKNHQLYFNNDFNQIQTI